MMMTVVLLSQIMVNAVNVLWHGTTLKGMLKKAELQAGIQEKINKVPPNYVKDKGKTLLYIYIYRNIPSAHVSTG